MSKKLVTFFSTGGGSRIRKSTEKQIVFISTMIFIVLFCSYLFCIHAEASEENTETVTIWEEHQNPEYEGFWIATTPIDGICTMPDKVDTKTQYQVIIDQDILWFRSIGGEQNLTGFSNYQTETDAYIDVLFRTESGIFGMTKVVQSSWSKVLTITSDTIINGMPVNEFLIKKMEQGETIDFWFSTGEWSSVQREYAVAHFTLVMNDPGFGKLLQSARERNWGFENSVSVPRLKSAYEKMNHQWTALHYSDRNGAYTEEYYIIGETEGIAVAEDGTGRKIKVDLCEDSLGLIIRLYIFRNGEWVYIQNSGESFSIMLRAFSGNGDYQEAEAMMWSGKSFIYLTDNTEYDDLTQEEQAVLHGLAVSGSCDIDIPLNIIDENGNIQLTHFYFSLQEYYSNYCAIYDEAEKTGWTEPVELASANGVALISLTQQENKNTYELDWVKLHTSDGQMYIRNREAYPGIFIRPDDSEEDAYLILLRAGEDCFFVILDRDGRVVKNPGVSVQCTKVQSPGYVNEKTMALAPVYDDGSGFIRLPGTPEGAPAINIMRLLLNDGGNERLDISYGNGDQYSFMIPVNDYQKLFDKVCCYWYIPTFNDEIYEGDEVHPDLVSFMETFIPLMEDKFAEAKQTNAVSKNEQLLQLIKEDAYLSLLYSAYIRLAEHELIRWVDTQYFENARAGLEADIVKQRFYDYADLLGKVSEKAKEFSPQIHQYFGDDIGNDYDLAIEIMKYGSDQINDTLD